MVSKDSIRAATESLVDPKRVLHSPRSTHRSPTRNGSETLNSFSSGVGDAKGRCRFHPYGNER